MEMNARKLPISRVSQRGRLASRTTTDQDVRGGAEPDGNAGPNVLAPGPTIALIPPRTPRVRNVWPQRITSAVRRCGHGDSISTSCFLLPYQYGR